MPNLILQKGKQCFLSVWHQRDGTPEEYSIR